MATATVNLFVLTLLSASMAFATQRHATPTGAGAHTGMDASNAWSFAEAMYAETGDTVNLHAGTYPYIFAPENSGTGSQPIVYRAFESDVVTITGVSDGNPDMVYFPGSYVELWNVYLITAENVAWNGNYAVSLGGDHNALHGVRLIKGGDIQTEYLSNNYRTRGVNIYGSYNTIDSCWIRGMVESVVLSGGSARYHKIRWNRIHNSALNGIICGGSNDGTTNWMGVLIEGNNIDSCGEDNMQWQQGTDPYSYEKNKGYIVRGNYLARAYENAIDRKGAAFVVCENNIMHTANSDDDGWTNGAEDWGTGPLIERGNPEALNEYYCLDRGNVMLDGPGGTTMSHGGQFINNLMANNRRKLTVSNTSDSTEDALKDINLEGSSTTRSVLNNILIGQPNHSYVWLWNMETSPLDIDNQLYYDTTGILRFYYRLSGGTSAKVYGLSAWQSRLNTTYTSFTGRDAHAISSNPLFVNFPFRPYSYNASWDWSLDAGSPAIGAARCWTFANGSGSSSTALVVDNPYVFTDGFGIVQGDSVYLHGAARRITSINYSTSTITLSASHTWSDNDSVWFYTAGAKVTNLGPYANVTTVVDTGGDPGGVPSTPVALTPANGSTKTSPVTFSWNRVSGAVDYWLCVSPDSWGTLIVDQAAITDTFYTVSLPGGGSYVWNVSAANSYGRSGWTADWTFSTSVASTYRDTVNVNWNKVSHTITVDTTSHIAMTNLQRRDVWVAVRNPGGKEISWGGVTWLTQAPPTIPPNESWYQFFRTDGDTVLGAYMNATGVSGSTWRSIVGNINDNAALMAAYTRKPSDVLYVSPAYTGLSSPYYSDVAAAVAAASSGDVIYIAPGTYTGGFTVAADNLTIIGEAPAEFQSSDSTFGAGVLINGYCNAGSKKNFTMQNVTIAKRDADGDVFTCGTTGSSKINHTYTNCRFVGTSWGNGYHAFLAQAGSHVTVRDCKVYRSTHGFAIRASYVSMSGLYAEDCGSESGIIIKAATGSGSAEYVTLTDFTVTATVAGRARGVIILCSNTGVRTSQVNITNGVIYGTASAGVYVLQDSGSVSDVTVSNVNVRKSGTSSFWMNTGTRVNFVNCISDSATNYGFLNSSGTNVSVAGCRVNASSTYSGAFSTEIAGAMQVFGAATLGSANVTGDLSVSGNPTFDVTVYLKSGLSVLNKAANNWLAVLTRNTSGSEAVYDADYLGNVGTRNTIANLFNMNATTVNFAGAADRINIGKTGDSVHVLGNLWAGGYDPVYGKYSLGILGTSFLFGTVYFKDDTWLGTYNGSSAGVKYTQSTGTVTHRATRFALSAIQTAPSSATDTGTVGEYRITATGIYICTATNTWIRCLGATW